MNLGKLFLVTATIALTASPTIAAGPNPPANPAAKLSLSKAVPASAQTETRKRNSGLWIGAVVAVAVIVGVVAASGGDDSPESS